MDATSGKLLQSTNRLQHVNGTGTVFAPNPIKTLDNSTAQPFNRSTSPLTYASFTDDGGTDYFTSTFPQVYFPAVLQELQSVPGSPSTVSLTGPSVNVTPNAITRDAPFDFQLAARDPNFVDVMAYYWIDSIARYIQGIIGAGLPDVGTSSLADYMEFAVPGGSYGLCELHQRLGPRVYSSGHGPKWGGLLRHGFGTGVFQHQYPGPLPSGAERLLLRPRRAQLALLGRPIDRSEGEHRDPRGSHRRGC